MQSEIESTVESRDLSSGCYYCDRPASFDVQGHRPCPPNSTSGAYFGEEGMGWPVCSRAHCRGKARRELMDMGYVTIHESPL